MLAEEGATVAMAARGLDGVKAAADRISRGGSCHAADVTNPAAALSLVGEIEKQWGRIDISFATSAAAPRAAGQGNRGRLVRVMDINLFATTNTIEAARPLMSRRRVTARSSACPRSAGSPRLARR